MYILIQRFRESRIANSATMERSGRRQNSEHGYYDGARVKLTDASAHSRCSPPLFRCLAFPHPHSSCLFLLRTRNCDTTS